MFRYLGSKGATAAKVIELVDDLPNIKTAADAFGGMGTIGAALKASGRKVTSCDVLDFPHAFQISRIECGVVPRFLKLKKVLGVDSCDGVRRVLNSRSRMNSWIVREYATRRKFFTPENAARIAGAWCAIKSWEDERLLSRKERAYLVASLLNSMDAVANTAGTYYAYLKNFHRKSLRPFRFEWLPIETFGEAGEARLGDAVKNLSGEKFDLLYLDPPYNKRNYAGYYHLPETLAALKQVKVDPDSEAGLPMVRSERGCFIREGTELDYILKLADKVKWRYLFVHYCDNAHIPLSALRKSLAGLGKMKEIKINALGYTTTQVARKINHHVFIVAA